MPIHLLPICDTICHLCLQHCYHYGRQLSRTRSDSRGNIRKYKASQGGTWQRENAAVEYEEKNKTGDTSENLYKETRRCSTRTAGSK